MKKAAPQREEAGRRSGRVGHPALVISILNVGLYVGLCVGVVGQSAGSERPDTPSPVEAGYLADYRLELSRDLRHLDVTVTPGPAADFTRLRSFNDNARDRLVRSSLVNLEPGRRSLQISQPGKPLHYRVDFRHSPRQGYTARFLTGGNVRISDWADWLWLPRGWHGQHRIRLQFVLPKGYQVTTPFQIVERGEGFALYDAMPVMLDHGGFAAFGDIGVADIEHPGGRVSIAVVSADPGIRERYDKWVRTVSDAVIGVHGWLPQASVQVAIVPAILGSGPVPWAHVRRGGGSAVIAYVNPSVSDTDLYRDWSLFHEFAHLYHPYLGRKGRWIAEGFASYYQNVYRARAGIVSADYAWSRLQAGLKRGAKEARQKPGRTVLEGGRMRTYWTGAALALDIDTRLREQSGGRDSLEKVMGRFAECCLPSENPWRPADYMRKLDQLSGTHIFSQLYAKTLSSTRFPQVAKSDALYEQIIMSGG